MDATSPIELLGRRRIAQGDRVIERFRTHKIAALLAVLANDLERPQPRESLIALLWPDRALEDGRNNLGYSLSSLRRQLEPPGVAAGSVIVADRAHARLNPATCTSDVVELRAALKAAKAKPVVAT